MESGSGSGFHGIPSTINRSWIFFEAARLKFHEPINVRDIHDNSISAEMRRSRTHACTQGLPPALFFHSPCHSHIRERDLAGQGGGKWSRSADVPSILQHPSEKDGVGADYANFPVHWRIKVLRQHARGGAVAWPTLFFPEAKCCVS